MAKSTIQFNTLLVEDDATSRMIMERALTQRGHVVKPCPDAESALDCWGRDDYDLVLLDWMLPGMTGVDLCRAVRSHGRGQHPVIVIITAKDSAKDLQVALDGGADDYIVKPIDAELLNIRLTIAERKAKERRERRQLDLARARLEDQVRYAQKLESLGVLAGGIAHDFNNLLMTILGNTNLAQIEAENYPDLLSYLETIEQTTLRASTLTNQLLAYSGRGKFATARLDISNAVREMQRVLTTVVNKKAVLHYELSDNLPPINADLSQLRQVLVNLVVNASEAIGERSGYIRIETGVVEADAAYLAQGCVLDEVKPGMYVFLEITDTGIGMDGSTLERIYDPFFTTKFVGRGLGLAAVLGIMRGHKGTIKVSSVPGDGSTFRVLFPVARELETLKLNDRNPNVTSNWQGKKALVADDEESVRNISKILLQKMGFTVVTDIDGADALDVYEKEKDSIDLILLDVTMPKMDGGEVLAAIRKTNTRVHIILTSGYSEADARDRYTAHDLSGFLHKPYGAKDLEAALAIVLGPRFP